MMIPRTCGIHLVISEIRTEISDFFLTPFTLAGVKVLHLHICRCTAHYDVERNGARIKSIIPTVSDLRSQKKLL